MIMLRNTYINHSTVRQYIEHSMLLQFINNKKKYSLNLRATSHSRVSQMKGASKTFYITMLTNSQYTSVT